ncbi:MAG TPA: STAS domain-containing protein [Nonomuraea sp.]|nr:STAS domain-containing protein [Nonomuraea sp.]
MTGDNRARITPVVHPCGLRLGGEIDRASRPRLAGALAWAVATCQCDVRLDLGKLDFIDAGGVRLIIDAAAGLPPPRRLILDPVPALARRLLRLLGWQVGVDNHLRPAVNGHARPGPRDASPPEPTR